MKKQSFSERSIINGDVGWINSFILKKFCDIINMKQGKDGKGIERKWNVPLGVRGLISGEVDWAIDQIPEFSYYLYDLKYVANLLPKMTVPHLKIYIKALRVSRAGNDDEFRERLLDYTHELKQVDEKESWMWAAFLKPSLIYILETADSEKTEIIDVIKNEITDNIFEIEDLETVKEMLDS